MGPPDFYWPWCGAAAATPFVGPDCLRCWIQKIKLRYLLQLQEVNHSSIYLNDAAATESWK